MNGAAAVPESSSNTPKSDKTITIGNSHHFLLFAKKSQNSRTMPPSAASEARSNSVSFLSSIMGSPELKTAEHGTAPADQPRRSHLRPKTQNCLKYRRASFTAGFSAQYV